ncbi:conserved hypothetical protein, partial [Ixodes scapularis]
SLVPEGSPPIPTPSPAARTAERRRSRRANGQQDRTRPARGPNYISSRSGGPQGRSSPAGRLPPSPPCSRSAGGVRARARPFFSQRRDKAPLAERAPAGRSLVVACSAVQRSAGDAPLSAPTPPPLLTPPRLR